VRDLVILTLFYQHHFSDEFSPTDFSNDDLDEDIHDSDNEPSSSLALSYKSLNNSSSELNKNDRHITRTFLNAHQNSQFKKYPSPNSSFDDNDLLTVNRQTPKKLRSLTPEKRSLTPEIYAKSSLQSKSQTAFNSRQSSGSRNSALEQLLKRYENEHSSQNFSSSSDENQNNQTIVNRHGTQFKANTGDYKIRRSR
jgi:hypothetical protein